ncbi:MAG: hypothetical protein AAFV93_04325 [Chloroflexota bacterium]
MTPSPTISTPSSTLITPTPTLMPPSLTPTTPSPTSITPTATPTEIPLPFGELQVYWRSDLFILYNASGQAISLEDLNPLTFRNDAGQEFSVTQWTNITEATAFRANKCMIAFTGSQPTNEEIDNFRRDCDLSDEPTSIRFADGFNGRDTVWQTGQFDVYYGERLIAECAGNSMTNQTECVIAP